MFVVQDAFDLAKGAAAAALLVQGFEACSSVFSSEALSDNHVDVRDIQADGVYGVVGDVGIEGKATLRSCIRCSYHVVTCNATPESCCEQGKHFEGDSTFDAFDGTAVGTARSNTRQHLLHGHSEHLHGIGYEISNPVKRGIRGGSLQIQSRWRYTCCVPCQPLEQSAPCGRVQESLAKA